jgi:hypothetical protein
MEPNKSGKGTSIRSANFSHHLALFGSKSGLDLLHLLGANLERHGEHIVGYLRRGREQRHGEGLRAGQLAVESRYDGGGRVPVVLLEVYQAAWEDEDVAGVDGLGDELVPGGYEADVQGALKDEHHLGGARVGMRRVQAARSVVDARHGHAEGVEAWHLLDIGAGDDGAVGGVGVTGGGQAFEVEVVLCHGSLAGEPVHLHGCAYKLTSYAASFYQGLENKKNVLSYSLDVRSATQMSWSKSGSPERDGEGRRTSMARTAKESDGEGKAIVSLLLCPCLSV